MTRLELLKKTEKELKDAINYFERKYTDYALKTGETDPAVEGALYQLRTSLLHNQQKIQDETLRLEEEKRLLEEQELIFILGYELLQENLKQNDYSMAKARQICTNICKDFLRSEENLVNLDKTEGLIEYLQNHEEEINKKYFSMYKKSLSL